MFTPMFATLQSCSSLSVLVCYFALFHITATNCPSVPENGEMNVCRLVCTFRHVQCVHLCARIWCIQNCDWMVNALLSTTTSGQKLHKVLFKETQIQIKSKRTNQQHHCDKQKCCVKDKNKANWEKHSQILQHIHCAYRITEVDTVEVSGRYWWTCQ